MTDTLTDHADPELHKGEPLIEMSEVGKSYGAIRALSGINLTVNAGAHLNTNGFIVSGPGAFVLAMAIALLGVALTATSFTWREHVTVDFVHPEADLSSYKVVVAPSLYLLGSVIGAVITGPFTVVNAIASPFGSGWESSGRAERSSARMPRWSVPRSWEAWRCSPSKSGAGSSH